MRKFISLTLAAVLVMCTMVTTAFAAGEPTVTVGIADSVKVGDTTEFTVSTTAGDKQGTHVKGTSVFTDADAVDVEYLEVKDGNWYPLKGTDFGPQTGFPFTDATSTFRATFKEAGTYEFTINIVAVESGETLATTTKTITVTDEQEPVEPAKVVMTDAGHFPGTSDWDDEAVFSAGWKYENIDTDKISSIKVGAKDAKGRLVVEYTADAEQVKWQKENGYITPEGLSSAPFYKEYKGEPIKAEDYDWNVTKGESFDRWQPSLFYVEVIVDGETYTAQLAYEYAYPHIHEAVKVDAKAATEDAAGNIQYWYCADCDKYFADAELTKEITKEDIVIPALGKGTANTDDPENKDNQENATDDNSPKTGDDSNIALLAALMLACGAAAVTVVYKRRDA